MMLLLSKHHLRSLRCRYCLKQELIEHKGAPNIVDELTA